MGNSVFKLDEFRAEIFKKGLARNNRFEVVIPSPPSLDYGTQESRFVSLLAESTNFPPINVGVTSQRIFGPSYQRPKFVDYGGDNIIITFLVDGGMLVKKYFEDWLELVIEPETYFVGYQDEYTTDISISQLDEDENNVYSITIYEAFPRSINIMDLNNTNTNSFHRLSVSFAYRYWSSKSKSEQNPVILPQGQFREQYENFKAKQNSNSNSNWKDNVIVPTEGAGSTTQYPGA